MTVDILVQYNDNTNDSCHVGVKQRQHQWQLPYWCNTMTTRMTAAMLARDKEITNSSYHVDARQRQHQ